MSFKAICEHRDTGKRYGVMCPFPASSCYFHILHFQNCSNISAKSLQQQLEVLELDSREWSAGAKEHERVLSCILEFCTTREEINEVGFAKDTLSPKRVSQCL